MKSTLFILTLVSFFYTSPFVTAQTKIHEVNLSGNSYVTEQREGANITEKGLSNWTEESSLIQTYVYFSKPQTISLYVKGVSEEKAVILVKFNKKQKKIKIDGDKFESLVGKYKIESPGYYAIGLQGIERKGKVFADVSSFLIHSEDDHLVYVHDFTDYWARRGPSVHLNFKMPKDTIEWFYNEVTVPEGNDVIGSYYMANGFGEGYFGMQCNSSKERRILFSVWSPFNTEDPKLIPDSLKIKMLRKGEGVYIGEFGNEGSGGQSFLRYNWKAGNTYKFLTQIKPDGKGCTIYTSYFFASDENRWRLIASFLRPQTDVYYTRAHSFLENFIPEQGYLSRQVYFGNQWYKTKDGRWISNNSASFSHDATAKAGVRLDYQGGYDKSNNSFYLRNCGFFSQSTKFGTIFQRNEESDHPEIDFVNLENL